MQVVESRWEGKTETLSKTDLGKELRDKGVLSKVVNALSDEEASELLDYMKAKRLDELTSFEAGALGMLARKLGKSGDRERLVSLLSNNCPREVGPVTIEYDLAVDERMKKMPDAFVALVEAYRVAQNAQAKATLLTALSDALPSLRASIPNDDAFVSACAEWHRKNRGRFKLSENTSSRGRITVSRPSRSRCLLWSDQAPSTWQGFRIRW